MFSKHLLSVVCFCALFFTLHSQKTFKTGVIFGFNAAQIDGDRHMGYRKFGFSAGLQGVTVLSDHWRFNIELLFSQRGSKSGQIDKASNQRYTVKALDLRLNYIEVPLLFQYLHYYRGNRKDYFYRYRFTGGVSFGRLLDSSIREPAPFTSDPPGTLFIRPFQPSFKKNDLSLVLGLTLMVNKHIGLTLRHTVSMNPLYISEATEEEAAQSLTGYFLTGQLLYEF